MEPDELQLLICDDGVVAKEFAAGETKSPVRYTVTVRCRRLGENTGKDMPKEEIEARCQRASSNEHEVLLVGLCHFQNPKHENQRIYKPLASFARDWSGWNSWDLTCLKEFENLP